MGRPRRIQFPGACYLVTLRGNNRQDLFLSNQDRRFFLTLLRSCKERYRLQVYAYCLMGHHVQLLLETAEPNLARMMQALNTAYTKYFNRQHNSSGHLFQGRYQALVVDKQSWLLELSGHVHLAPAREGAREKPWRYPWSSCGAYVEAVEREPLVDSEAVLGLLARNRLKQSVQYLHFIKERLRPASRPALPLGSWYVGGEEFAGRLLRQARDGPQDPPAERHKAREMLEEALARSGVEEEKLLGRGRWRELSAVRKELVHRLWKEGGMGVSQIARMFHRTPAAVSQVLKQFEFPSSSGRKNNLKN